MKVGTYPRRGDYNIRESMEKLQKSVPAVGFSKTERFKSVNPNDKIGPGKTCLEHHLICLFPLTEFDFSVDAGEDDIHRRFMLRC